jgi:hypothetical protein
MKTFCCTSLAVPIYDSIEYTEGLFGSILCLNAPT